jgi:hypothetical protein
MAKNNPIETRTSRMAYCSKSLLPSSAKWTNRCNLLHLQDALLDWFVQICGKQVRKRGEILLDVDSTDDPTYGQQQLSFSTVVMTSTCITPC